MPLRSLGVSISLSLARNIRSAVRIRPSTSMPISSTYFVISAAISSEAPGFSITSSVIMKGRLITPYWGASDSSWTLTGQTMWTAPVPSAATASLSFRRVPA